MSNEQPWQLYGACRTLADPDVMFPVGKGGPTATQERQAKAICADCPVIQQCRTWALNNREEWGVWGGMSEADRRAALKTGSKRDDATGNRTGVRKRVQLSHMDEDTILARLDHGYTYPQVMREMRLHRDVCERVWREHRSSTYPPYRSKTRTQEAPA